MLIKAVMTKVANYKLPENSRLWTQEVLKHLFEENDWINADNYFLRWNSAFDGERGYATGVVVLSKGKNAVSIPVVIKDFELEPLDVFYRDGEFLPLTERTINQAFTDAEMTDKIVDKGGEAESLAKDFFPPRWGKYLTASANPQSICSSIFIDEEDKKELAERVKESAAYFHGNSVATAAVRNLLKQENPEPKTLTKVSSAILSSDSDVGFHVAYVEDGSQKEVSGSYARVHDFLKEAFAYDKHTIDKLLSQVDKKGAVAIQTREKLAALDQKDMIDIPVSEINSDAYVNTLTKSGQLIEGQVIPRTYNFELRRFTRNKLLVSRDKRVLGYAEKIVGQHKGQDFNSIIANRRVVITRPGLIVSFAWKGGGEGMGHSILAGTEPAKIMSVEEIKGVGKLFTLIASFGGRHKAMLVPGLERPVFDRKNEYDAIYLPGKSIILSADDKPANLVSDKEEFKQIVSGMGDSVLLSKLGSTNEILLQGFGMSKSAKAKDITLQLVDFGIDHKKAEGAVKLAHMLGHTKLYVEKPPLEKTASIDEKPFQNLVEDLRTIKKTFDLVKIASGIEDADTVDKVLSLSLINEKNLSVYYDMLPGFKETVRKLAHLLVASRLGEMSVNESAVESAMRSLQSLIEKMEGIKIPQ